MEKIVAIVGPTAAGKTEYAIRLAEKFNGELISADSRQIYKGMDIGTAKDKSYPQHLIDILSPKSSFNILRFKNLALKHIREILAKNRVPILVGGSGLYLNTVLYNLEIPEVKADKKLRAKLEKMTVEELREKLKKLDALAAEKTGKNKRRIIRALEVVLKTGSFFSSQRKKGEPLFDTLIIGIKIPREKLYEKINKRVDKQIEEGLIEEVKSLIKKYGKNSHALRNTIAYKEFIPYLEKKISLEEAIEETKKNSRRFSRRQITWFKAQPGVRWVDSYREAEAVAKRFLET